MEEAMIESFFVQATTCAKLRQAPAGPFLDIMAAELLEDRYSRGYARREIRGAAKFSRWLVGQGLTLEAATETAAARYLDCLGRLPNGTRPHAVLGVKRLVRLLSAQYASSPPEQPNGEAETWLDEFDQYLQRVVGLAPGTRRQYLRTARLLIEKRCAVTTLPWHTLKPQDITDFVTNEMLRRRGPSRRGPITATRALLRFLIFRGEVDVGMLAAVPPLREWKLASLPQYLSSADVARVLASVDETVTKGIRDKAILLLLSRLGLRACEVAHLDLDDIDWRGGRVLVRANKTQRERWLPLQQEVGCAIVCYLKEVRPRVGAHAGV